MAPTRTSALMKRVLEKLRDLWSATPSATSNPTHPSTSKILLPFQVFTYNLHTWKQEIPEQHVWEKYMRKTKRHEINAEM